MGFPMNLYMVQEFLGVLLLLAVSTATILVFAVAFILFQEGTRRAVHWAKTDVIRLADYPTNRPLTSRGAPRACSSKTNPA
jgi:hypothetical protein